MSNDNFDLPDNYLHNEQDWAGAAQAHQETEALFHDALENFDNGYYDTPNGDDSD